TRSGKPPTTRETESEWLRHKPTRMEAESQPPAREPQTPPRISFSPLMQNCTPTNFASSYLDWVNSAVSRTNFPRMSHLKPADYSSSLVCAKLSCSIRP